MFTDCSFSLQEFWLPIFSSFFTFKNEDERNGCFSNILCLLQSLTQNTVFLLTFTTTNHAPNGTITLLLYFASSYKLPKPITVDFTVLQDSKFINASPAPSATVWASSEHYQVTCSCASLDIQTTFTSFSAIRKCKFRRVISISHCSIYFIFPCPYSFQHTHTHHTGFFPVP